MYYSHFYFKLCIRPRLIINQKSSALTLTTIVMPLLAMKQADPVIAFFLQKIRTSPVFFIASCFNLLVMNLPCIVVTDSGKFIFIHTNLTLEFHCWSQLPSRCLLVSINLRICIMVAYNYGLFFVKTAFSFRR